MVMTKHVQHKALVFILILPLLLIKETKNVTEIEQSVMHYINLEVFGHKM